MDESFGRMIRVLRDARRWTQEKLAEEAGLDQTTVSNTERDKGQPTLMTVMKLATVFDADPHDWAVRTGHFPAPSPATDPPLVLARDSDRLSIDEMVADIEARKGVWYQQQLAEARQRLSYPDYRTFCADLWRMFEGNSVMAFDNMRRSFRDVSPGDIAKK